MTLSFGDKCKLLARYLIAKYLWPRLGPKSLRRHQDRRLRRIFDEASIRSPYYRALRETGEGGSWDRLPIVEPDYYRARFDKINTLGLARDAAMRAVQQGAIGGATVGLSSGTSGDRGLFVVTRHERVLYAANFLAKILPRTIFGVHRVAYFLRADSDLYSSSRSRRIQFAYFDLSQSVEARVARLNEFRPTFLFAPPSVLRKLAELKLAGILNVDPERLVTGAEVLDLLDQEVIVRAFGKPVYQVYQCTEGFLGASCRFGTLHLNEELVFFEREYLDKSHTRFYPVITDLFRLGQPYLRYRMTDILELASEPCPCGSPLTGIKRILGRRADIFLFEPLAGRTDAKWVEVLPDEISGRVIRASALITEYQIVQTAADKLVLHLRTVANPGTDIRVIEQAVEATFAELATTRGFRRPTIQFDYAIPAPGVEKMRRVKREFQPAGGSGLG